MIKSELITAIARKQSYLAEPEVELVVKCLVNKMAGALSTGQRIEIRGFGSFSLVERLPMIGRNPRTGEPVSLPKRYSVRFKAGLELSQRVRDSVQRYSLKSNNE
jgi:integration host factor subunit beta